MSDEYLKLMLESINEKVSEIYDVLYGKGGLVLDVDRLKESHRKQAKIIWMIVGALVPVVISVALKYLGLS